MMASWGEFERQRPAMAAAGRTLLQRHQVCYLATVRHGDAGPRVHQVCPAIVGDHLYVSIAPSAKLRDLRRDPRFMLHFMCGEVDAEFNARGTARAVTHEAELNEVRRDAHEQGLNFTEREVLFRLDLGRADTAAWQNFGTPQIKAVRERWQAHQPI